VREPVEDSPPFRWDLVTPDQLGSMVAGVARPDLWFLDELIPCTGKVLARSGNGDLYFVGRSLDSMFDLLSGALAGEPDRRALHRLPLSFQRPWTTGRGRRQRPLSPGEVAQARRVLASVGLAPHALARRRRPATFVDVVDSGSTFTELFGLLRDWIAEERESWPVVRRKLRFVGITVRRPTSPHTYRWQQHQRWTRDLPARAVVNVSMDGHAWGYFGDHQAKLTRSYRPQDWLAERSDQPGSDRMGSDLDRSDRDRPDRDRPDRDERTLQGLAEAVAVVAHGRSDAGRRAIARAMTGEPARAQSWLRALMAWLNRGG
jgi:hypothetical protein